MCHLTVQIRWNTTRPKHTIRTCGDGSGFPCRASTAGHELTLRRNSLHVRPAPWVTSYAPMRSRTWRVEGRAPATATHGATARPQRPVRTLAGIAIDAGRKQGQALSAGSSAICEDRRAYGRTEEGPALGLAGTYHDPVRGTASQSTETAPGPVRHAVPGSQENLDRGLVAEGPVEVLLTPEVGDERGEVLLGLLEGSVVGRHLSSRFSVLK